MFAKGSIKVKVNLILKILFSNKFFLMIQVVTTIAEIPFIANLFKPNADGTSRSLDVEAVTDMLRFAMDSVEKLQALYEN
jgi:hypothetical protein